MCYRNHLVRSRGSAHDTSGRCPFHITKFSPGRSCWARESYSCPEYLMEIGYPSKTHLKLKSCKILFIHNTYFNCTIVLKFYTEYGSIIATHSAKFLNDWANRKLIIGKQDFAKFVFKMGFVTDHQTKRKGDITEPLNHTEGNIKWPLFHQRHFQMNFLEWKSLYFNSNFIEICSPESN